MDCMCTAKNQRAHVCRKIEVSPGDWNNLNAKHSQNEICLVLFLKLDKTHLIFFLAIVENSVGKCDWGWAIVEVSPSNGYQVKRKTLTEVLL